MMRTNSLDSLSTEFYVFCMHRSSEENCPAQNNTPTVLNSTQLSGALAREAITISSIASPEPQIVMIDSDSNEPTIANGFGNQQPIVPPGLNDISLLPNPFNVLANMAVIQPNEEYSPQSPEPADPSPISTPPMNLSTIEGWETPHTSSDNATFYSEDPRRFYWDISSNDTCNSNEPRPVSFRFEPIPTPPPPQRRKKKLSMGLFFFAQKGSVAAHLRRRPSIL